jgi:hypothetical protein
VRVGTYTKKLKEHPEKESKIWQKAKQTVFEKDYAYGIFRLIKCSNSSITRRFLNCLTFVTNQQGGDTCQTGRRKTDCKKAAEISYHQFRAILFAAIGKI